MEYISLDKYFRILIKRWKIILYFTLVFVVLAILYGLLFYKSTYTSESKILLKQDNPNTYVTELNSDTQIYPLGPNKNPVLTQIEVLNSKDMSIKIVDKLSNESGFEDIPQKNLSSIIQHSIKYNNPIGTDIIEISTKWNNPENAQKIAKILLDSYSNYNEALHKKSVASTKSYIEKQLKDTNKQLSDIREKIENYRTKNSSINIDLEAQSIITQTERTENLISDVNVNISALDRKVNELSKNLGDNLKKVVDSVALGHSESMIKLNETLLEEQQKLASLKIKYPMTTPQIKILNSEITEIKLQIENQTVALIGKHHTYKNNSIISDDVRSNMVQNYVQNTLDLNSNRAQKETLQKIMNKLKANQKMIPEMQRNLLIMQEKEKNLALIAETLNAKLVEAKIKESAIVSNVDIVESPTFPTGESAPTLIHIVAFFVLAGVLLGTATIIGLYYLEDICDGQNDLEDIIKAPVLGIMPWLTNTTYKHFLTDYNPHSVVAIIYQKIITSLKIKCYKKKINSIGIISAELEKRRSIVTASLANTFAKGEDRIILIDTDFRDGSLTREFNIDFSKYPDITDLVLELSKLGDVENYNKIISKFIVQIPEQKNLFLIPNNNKINNPYEILNHEVFPKLIQNLKANFDFVIVDSPPILAVADSIITSQYIDGLVVLCGVKTSRSNLRKIRKICDENYVEILGAIARDALTELEVPENMYIKQLSSNNI